MDDQTRKQLLEIRDCYHNDTRNLLRFLERKGLDLDARGLEAYVAYLKKTGYAASTINKRLQAAKHRFRLVFRQSGGSLDVLQRYEVDTALKEIKGVKRNTRAVDLEKTLTLEELRRLVKSERVPGRTRLMIEFLACTGVRASELAGIRIQDLGEEHGYVAVRIVGKGTKERYLKVRPGLVQRIRAVFAGDTYLFETQGGKPYTRQEVSGWVRSAGRLMLGRRISAHTLRHTFATLQIRKNRKVKALSVYLGHSSTAITQDMYVHEELDLEDLDMGL